MKLFTRGMHLFCVSNIMVSFVCTGLLGINSYDKIIEGPKENKEELALSKSDAEPVSHLGEEEKRENTLVCKLPSTKNIEEAKKKEIKTTTVSKSTSKKTTNVVTKKQVAKTVTYSPAKYSSVTGEAIVSYAKKYIGLRYKTGTPSLTNGADCSGFTQLIYREFGVSLPRTVSGQIGRGTYIKKSDLQKGDLVFYKGVGSRGGASHVGIYIGSGQVIHESRPGVGVKISSVNMMQYVTARRVINSKAKEIAEQKQLEEQKKNENNTDNLLNENETNNDNIVVTENNKNNETNNVVENKINNETNNVVENETNNVVDNKINNETVGSDSSNTTVPSQTTEIQEENKEEPKKEENKEEKKESNEVSSDEIISQE